MVSKPSPRSAERACCAGPHRSLNSAQRPADRLTTASSGPAGPVVERKARTPPRSTTHPRTAAFTSCTLRMSARFQYRARPNTPSLVQPARRSQTGRSRQVPLVAPWQSTSRLRRSVSTLRFPSMDSCTISRRRAGPRRLAMVGWISPSSLAAPARPLTVMASIRFLPPHPAVRLASVRQRATRPSPAELRDLGRADLGCNTASRRREAAEARELW